MTFFLIQTKLTTNKLGFNVIEETRTQKSNQTINVFPTVRCSRNDV